MSRRGRGKSIGRVTGFSVEGPFDETAMEKLLEAAKVRGVVTEYDTGRGAGCWFNGPPGPALRALRDEAVKLAAAAGPR